MTVSPEEDRLRRLALWATAEVVHHPEYSAGKWRIEDITGRTLTEMREHPSDPSLGGYHAELAFDTKREAVARLQKGRRLAAHQALALDRTLSTFTLAVFAEAAGQPPP